LNHQPLGVNEMQITEKCKASLKAYIIHRAKYGICGAKINLPHLRMLENANMIVRGPFATVQEFTIEGEAFVASLFAKA